MPAWPGPVRCTAQAAEALEALREEAAKELAAAVQAAEEQAAAERQRASQKATEVRHVPPPSSWLPSGTKGGAYHAAAIV